MKVLHVVGARPNFMKTAALMHAMERQGGDFEQVLVHTGQHYDRAMSDVFFEELGLPEPDAYLSVGSGTHAEQTARTIAAFEPVLVKFAPDVVVVVGDVNSTIACALVAVKLGVKIAHVEAGLRSFDRTMPEEINRILTDQIADYLFTPSRDGDANLAREGVDPKRVFFVGNVMIDTLVRLLPKTNPERACAAVGVKPNHFALATLHRPSNVDDAHTLTEIMKAMAQVAEQRPVVFPVHPRTRASIDDMGLASLSGNVKLIEPAGYLDFLALESVASIVMTDSGGVQEETAYLGVPCLTLRPNTERPVTIESGMNRLVASRTSDIVGAVDRMIAKGKAKHTIPDLWDGHASERIARILLEH
ncbi:MAG TPA: UDP-N-acetylglucosamine 2-epimerase (non-hydrolyzing) [Gemmatimonadaceae bacterium]|nr:UDP-N-acetylglucosamine 2-epimerase (non-hydrolyzing) [Gemmatimonadaceae bacterium]